MKRYFVYFLFLIGSYSITHAEIKVRNFERLPFNERGELSVLLDLTYNADGSKTSIKIQAFEHNLTPRPNDSLPKVITNQDRSIIVINFSPITEVHEAYVIIETGTSFKVIPNLGLEIIKQLEKFDVYCTDKNVVVNEIKGNEILARHKSYWRGGDPFNFKVLVLPDGSLKVKDIQIEKYYWKGPLQKQ